MTGSAPRWAAAVVAGLLAGAALAAAQPVAEPPTTQRVDAQAEPAPVQQQIRTLEQALAAAVDHSTRAVEAQLPAGLPGVVLFAGPIQVRGFRLEDYGVFFDVEYPVLRRSIVWSMQRLDPFELSLDAALEGLRRRFPRAEGAPPFSGRGRPAVEVAAPASPRERVADGPRRRAGGGRFVAGAGGANGRGRLAVDVQRVYQGALRVALTDALLQAGGALGALLPAEARLTVGARDAAAAGRDGRLRVLAGDLAAFSAGALALEELRTRVEASGF